MTPEETAALVHAITADAKRLGLVWTIRPATVNSIDSTGVAAAGTYDGDITQIPLINIVGAGAGERVYVIGIPQGGNYIVGFASRHDALVNPYGLHGTGTADGPVSSATFVNLAAPSSFTFTKVRPDTRVRVQMSIGFFTSAGTAGMEAGVTFDGGTNSLAVTRLGPTSAAGVHLHASGVQYYPGPLAVAELAAGDYTVQGQWRRIGTGTISRDGQDWLSIECLEVAP